MKSGLLFFETLSLQIEEVSLSAKVWYLQTDLTQHFLRIIMHINYMLLYYY